MAEVYDVVIVGAGPGGYVAAIRCAQLGLSTALVEQADLGGLCLNRGCIPSKAMLRSAELVALLREAADFGILAPEAHLGYQAMVTRRDRVVAHLLQGVTNLLRGNGITILKGTARVRDAQAIEVVSPTDHEVVEYRHLIVATGSRSAPLPVPGADLPGLVDSDGALLLSEAPRQVLVIGGGPVGVEWAEVWRACGSQVTVLELLPQLVPQEEPEIGRELLRAFTRKGIPCHLSGRVREIRPGKEGLEVLASLGRSEEVFSADVVLNATGRLPNLESLNLQAAGVRVEPKGIPTDDHMRTNLPHVYAVGDVTGEYLLAHVASHQGIIAAETIAGRGQPFDRRAVPSVIFTSPEIARVGLKEAEATGQGFAVSTGRFPLAASGRAQASGQTEGFVKIVAQENSGEVLGVHIIGPRAGELIGEATLAIRLGATVEDLARTIHPHPTFSEALMEAAWATLGAPIHIPPRRQR